MKKKLHLAELTQASDQATNNHKFMKGGRKECCLLKGPPACLTRSKARRYNTLLDSSGKEEIDVPCFSVGSASGPHLTCSNARRFSSRFADFIPAMLLHKWLMRILCRKDYNDLKAR